MSPSHTHTHTLAHTNTWRTRDKGCLWWVIISNCKAVVWFRDPQSPEAFSEIEWLIGGNRALRVEGREGLWVPGWVFLGLPVQSWKPGPSEAGKAHMRVPTWLRQSGCQRKPKGPNLQDMPSNYFSTCGFCGEEFLLLLKGWVSKLFLSYITFLYFFEQGSNFPAVFAYVYSDSKVIKKVFFS